MPRAQTERVLRELGTAQHGVAARAQLLALGLSRHTVDRMLREGRVQRIGRGLYQIGPLPALRAREAAAALACGPDGCVSHLSAALLHGLLDTGSSGARRCIAGGAFVEVTVPRIRRLRIAGVRVHRVRDLRPGEVMTIDGIPVTTPARTLLDLAATLPARDVEQVLAATFRLALVNEADMLAMAEDHPRHRGAGRLRGLLCVEGGPPFTRSEAEEKMLGIIRSARLSRPEPNVKVCGYEVDFLWRPERLIAEVDGYTFHGSARSFRADRRRDADLAAAGYRVLRFTWADVTDGRMATVARLAQALTR